MTSQCSRWGLKIASYIESKGFLGIEYFSFLNKAIPLFIMEIFSFKCMPKFNFESNTRPRCFWKGKLWTPFPMKVRLEWTTLDFSLEIKSSLALFLGSGLKGIYHWSVHLLIFSRSLFKFLAVSLTFLTAENRDVSSADSLGEQQSSEGRLFIQIRKNSGPELDPWVIPAVFFVPLKG